MTNQKDINKIAEIFRKRIEPLKAQILKEENHITKDRYKFMLLELIGTAKDFADYFEEEINSKCQICERKWVNGKCSEYPKTHGRNKEFLFNPTHFLKKAGVQE